MSPHYGCRNRPPLKQFIALHDHHGRLVSSWPVITSPGCQYTHTDLGRADARCEGCKHKALEATNLEATQGNAC